MIARWLRIHFADAEQARTTISIVSVALGAIGFALVLFGVFFAH